MATVEEMMLIKVSATENNNKFYHIQLMDDGSVHKRWGRVGANGQRQVERGGKTAYDRIIRDKQRHGYKQVDVVAADIKPAEAGRETLRTVAKTMLVGEGNKASVALESLIERLVTANRHEILEASGGMIKINTDGVISTPLGLVSLASIEQAESVLKRIKGSSTVPATLVEEYMSLVPQKVKRDRGWVDTFFADPASVQAQFDFLKQLRDSYAWAEAEKKATAAATKNDDITEKYKNLFRFTISEVTDSKVIAEITKRYETTKNSTHSAARLKVKRVFALADPSGDATYDQILSDIGNEKRLWHGTRAFNVLSILRKGLFVPPVSGTSIVTTGRMFGDGVYFSDQSTKSLNYSYGYWGGGSATRDDNCFMFLADVAMGWEFQPNRHGVGRFDTAALRKAHSGTDANGRRFNSISVKGGTCGVMNNEMIIWNTDQIRLRYLVEFGR